MKKLIIAAVGIIGSLLSTQALAFSICVGETHSGKRVEVLVHTVGTMSFLQKVSVNVTTVDGEFITAYELSGDKASFVYETVFDDARKAVVGLTSYDVDSGNSIVAIDYVGGNYPDIHSSLWEALAEDYEETLSRMVVWMGPGHPSSAHYEFNDVACSVGLDP